MNIRWKLRRIITTRLTISKITLSIIEYLQRVNDTMKEFLLDAHEQTKINRMIKNLQLNMLCKRLHLEVWTHIDFDYFNEVYKIFVERKRRKMLADADELDEKRMEYMRSRIAEGLPHAATPLGMYIKEKVLVTYYAYLRDDDAYMQKAFLEFLKKKIEDGHDCLAIAPYLEKKYKHSSYEECEKVKGYGRYMEGSLDLGIPEIWLEFFQSGMSYTEMIPDEKPQVIYWRTDKGDIPRFIFERPYTKEFTEWEFHEKFIEEWDMTHGHEEDNGYCGYDPLSDPYDIEYLEELANRPEEAYHQYVIAVNRFRSAHNI